VSEADSVNPTSGNHAEIFVPALQREMFGAKQNAPDSD
jgi:hypothetical protein